MFGLFGQDDDSVGSGDSPGDGPADWMDWFLSGTWTGPWREPAARLGGALIKLLLHTSGRTRERWTPVGRAAKRLGTVVGELFVKAMTVERPERFEISGEAAEAINARVLELMNVLPSVADTYTDVERVDRAMQDGQMAVEIWQALSEVLDFVATAVDAVVERVVRRALDPEGPPLEVERIEKTLSILEAIVREVLLEWVLPRTIQSRRDERG